MSNNRSRYLRAACTALLLASAGCGRHAASITSPSGRATPAPLITAEPGTHVIPGAYIVVFDESAGDVNSLADDLGRRHAFQAGLRFQNSLRGFAGRLSPEALTQVRNDPRVAFVEQDQIVTADDLQSNPPNWGLDRIDQPALPLDQRYDAALLGTDVDAYVIDTGITLSHSDFQGRAITGYDAITPSGQALDGNGHGTHVASTIGGHTYGVAKNVRLIAVRVLDANGSGTMSGVIAGVDWVTSNHTTRPAVANMSLGGGASPALDAAVQNSIADGIVYCVAAGNSSVNAANTSPARVPQAITVAACDRNDRFASFSNFGPAVDIIAPGVDITAAWYTSASATNTISGTSMATPHVAGAAAAYLQANPAATPAGVAAMLVTVARVGIVTGTPRKTENRLLQRLTGAPLAPGLATPKAAAKNQLTSLTLTWTAPATATGYTIEVSTDAKPSVLVASGSPGAASFAISGLALNTRYVWHVKSANQFGNSNWSELRGFTTAKR